MIESVLLVPGSWHGAWAYDDVAAHLRAEGLAVRVIDLPSNDGAAGLPDDAAAIRAALDEIGTPTLVVGHSYGGIAVSEGAADSPAAAGLVYLCAFMVDAGESLLDVLEHRLPDWIALDETTRSHVPSDAERALYNDCDPAVAAAAAARLTPQSLVAIATPQSTAAWRRLPSTYVVCDRDAAVPPPAQKAMATRAQTIERLDASHSPFLSRPRETAALIERALSGSAVPSR